MISNVQHFTLESVDEKHYNRIQVTLPSMCFNSKVSFNVSQLLTNCNIRVLNERDYLRMKIDGVIKDIQFEDRTDLNTASVSIIPYHEVVVHPFQEYGGYTLRGEHLPTCVSGMQVVRLYSGTRRVDYEFSQT